MGNREKKLIVWEVKDWEHNHPTEEVEAYTNTEALEVYIQKHGIDTKAFHLIEARFLRYAFNTSLATDALKPARPSLLLPSTVEVRPIITTDEERGVPLPHEENTL